MNVFPPEERKDLLEKVSQANISRCEAVAKVEEIKSEVTMAQVTRLH